VNQSTTLLEGAGWTGSSTRPARTRSLLAARCSLLPLHQRALRWIEQCSRPSHSNNPRTHARPINKVVLEAGYIEDHLISNVKIVLGAAA
jgi:hypothetical protein